MNLKELGDSLFENRFDVSLVKKFPYHTFIVLSAMVEFLGRCYNIEKESDLHKKCVSEENFKLALNITALKKYRSVKTPSGEELYDLLRCGMLHSLLPYEGVTLGRDKNDLKNNVIGAKDFYEDLQKAWKEVCSDSKICKKMSGLSVLTVDDCLSAATPSNNSTQK